uniref:Peptidase metallopeptidase domain-containing protein n=1 Tax=Panagrolaimus davidi TaxID=227884 RepID=A0A914PFQ6_9BILA
MIIKNLIIILYFISSLNAFYLANYSKSREKRAVLDAAIAYLKQYDYITDKQLASPYKDKYLIDGLKRCQKLLGLKPTGQIDPETVKKIGEPRCGRSDIFNVRNSELTPWKNQTITYSLVTKSTRFSHDDLKRTMREIFDAWSDHIPRQFQEVTTEAAADIKIRFGKREHGDGKPFDGEGGILGHATITGILHFDDDDLFKRYARSDSIIDATIKDMFWVALHEAGHVLGLDHINDNPSIMAPIYFTSMDSNGNYIEPNLVTTDITKVQSIYGGKQRPKIDTNHVANGGPFTAYAMVQKDREYLRSITFEFFQNAQKSNWNMTEIPTGTPFTEIVSGAFKAFNPGSPSNQMVYVTIFTHDIATGSVVKIVDAYEVMSDRGVVISADNKLYDATTGKMWVDLKGVDHSRRPKNV